MCVHLDHLDDGLVPKHFHPRLVSVDMAEFGPLSSARAEQYGCGIVALKMDRCGQLHQLQGLVEHDVCTDGGGIYL